MSKNKELEFFLNKKYSDFIEDFESKWLQYASAEERTKAFFGNLSRAKKLFKKWQNGEDVFANRIKKEFSQPFKFS